MSLNAELLGKLRRGELVAYGYSNQAPLDAPRRLIAAERWQELELDAKSSTASGPGIEVTQLRIYLPGSAGRRRPDPARKSHSPSALRKWYVERLELCARAGRL
ncbi:hypothetical protein NKH36_34290, partial [Mesorhizobium sp. M1312]|uniref:hypothetical protein n=1 Tax=unclassified Mesorhizobium TaxID=325217 RepID=UPI0033373209